MRPLLVAALLACALPAGGAGDRAPFSRNEAIRRGTGFLVAAQNPDGSWGSGVREVRLYNTGWPAETYRAWKVATTALACQALMAHPETPKTRDAILKGIDYLLANTGLKRSNNWDTDYVWGLIYSLETLSLARRNAACARLGERIDKAVPPLMRHLLSLQNPSGGWNYYDYTAFNWPAVATSFTTANAVLALHAARGAGYAVPERPVQVALGAIRRMRLPTGAYAYLSDAVPDPMQTWRERHKSTINDPRGSLARIQIANLALRLERDPDTDDADLARGLDLLFEHHKFLDTACYHHIPHDAFHSNSGYFYLYGHAYARQVIRRLPEPLREGYRARLDREVLKLQGPDGSWWDYPLHGFARPYGTAFALIALAD